MLLDDDILPYNFLSCSKFGPLELQEIPAVFSKTGTMFNLFTELCFYIKLQKIPHIEYHVEFSA